MPAEAIHLSAFADSLVDSDAEATLRAKPLFELARLGALTIDFPYFERFPLAVLRYLLARPLAVSSWGDLFHKERPVSIGKNLLFTAKHLSGNKSTRDDAQRVLALGLGFLSHIAVDSSLHPMVNRLARERGARLGELAARQHNEVEKYQSVLFHEERLGFDFMGTDALRKHIAVEAQALHKDRALCAAFTFAVQNALHKPLAPNALRAWTKGYQQFVALVSSPAGKLLAPEPMKREVREELYRGASFDFSADYAQAVSRSRAVLNASLALYQDGRAKEAAFDALVPEGSIDQ